MKKLGLLVKEITRDKIKDRLKESKSVFILRFSGLSSPDVTSLRQSLKEAHLSFFVAKNSVLRRAMKDAGIETIAKNIEGPCGLLFIKDDPVRASGIVSKFWREHQALKLQAALLEDRVLEKKDIEAIASLPPREILRAYVAGALKAPISGLVFVLKQTLSKLVWCLDGIKKKKGN